MNRASLHNCEDLGVMTNAPQLKLAWKRTNEPQNMTFLWVKGGILSLSCFYRGFGATSAEQTTVEGFSGAAAKSAKTAEQRNYALL